MLDSTFKESDYGRWYLLPKSRENDVADDFLKNEPGLEMAPSMVGGDAALAKCGHFLFWFASEGTPPSKLARMSAMVVESPGLRFL